MINIQRVTGKIPPFYYSMGIIVIMFFSCFIEPVHMFVEIKEGAVSISIIDCLFVSGAFHYG